MAVLISSGQYAACRPIPVMSNIAVANETRKTDAEIIAEHEKLIRHIARPFANRGVELDDLMQVGRMTLLAAIKSWRGESSIWTYARRSVVRDIIRFVTNETNEPLQLSQEDQQIMDEAPTPDEAFETSECISIVVDEMINLTEGERRIIRLRFVEGIDVRSIALLLDTSKSNVDRIYQAAIVKLRERLEARS